VRCSVFNFIFYNRKCVLWLHLLRPVVVHYSVILLISETPFSEWNIYSLFQFFGQYIICEYVIVLENNSLNTLTRLMLVKRVVFGVQIIAVWYINLSSQLSCVWHKNHIIFIQTNECRNVKNVQANLYSPLLFRICLYCHRSTMEMLRKREWLNRA
jgi:hypothetical protein